MSVLVTHVALCYCPLADTPLQWRLGREFRWRDGSCITVRGRWRAQPQTRTALTRQHGTLRGPAALEPRGRTHRDGAGVTESAGCQSRLGKGTTGPYPQDRPSHLLPVDTLRENRF